MIKLFFEFFKFGCFTFGGGWSIIAQMQKLYVEERREITNEELLDITSVARSIPGTMIGNVAMLFGYHMAGILGGVMCVIGMILPPMIVLTVITYFYSIFQDNVWVAAAMTGVRAAVVPIVFSVASRMMKGAFAYAPCYVIFAVAIILNVFFDVSCIWIVVMGAVCGLFVCEIIERKGDGKA
jgi:chromate transporter